MTLSISAWKITVEQRKCWKRQWGERGVHKHSGRDSCEVEATITGLLLWSATVQWICSNPHGLHPCSEARRSVGSSSGCGSASVSGTGRAGPHLCVGCCCPRFCPEGLVTTSRAKLQPLQCSGAAMVLPW